MKKLFSFFTFCLFVAVSLSFAACENEDPAPYPDPDPVVELTFELTVPEVADTTAEVKVVPSVNDGYYFFDVVAAELVGSGAAFATVADYAKAVLTQLHETAEWGAILYKGEQTHTFTDLSEQTDYILFALGTAVGTDGTLTLGEPSVFNFTTGESVKYFTLDIKDVTPFSVTVAVDPDIDGEYLYSVVLKSTVESGVVEGGITIDSVESYAKALVKYLDSNDSLYNAVAQGTASRTWDAGIVPDSDYYAFAVGINTSSLEFTTTFTVEEFRTGELTTPLFSFDITDVTASSAKVAVTASNEGMKYLFEVIDKATFDSYFEGNGTVFMEYMVEEVYEPQLGVNGQTWSNFLSWSGHNDKANYSYSLTGSTEYVVVAAGVDTLGNVYSETEIAEFTTEPVVPSDNWFEIWDERGLVIVETGNNDPYVLAVFKESEVAGLAGDELINKVVSTYGGTLYSHIYTGTKKFNYAVNLTEFGDYVVVVFGYDGGVTTEVATYGYTFEAIDMSEFSTLDRDFEYEAANAYGDYASVVYYGDYYGNGGGDWCITVYGYDGTLLLEVVDDKVTKEGLAGTFDIDATGLYTYPVGKAYGGIVYGSWYDLYGTWLSYAYVWDDEYGWLNFDAAADSGTVDISLGGYYVEEYWGEVYENFGDCNIDANFKDPNGNSVHYTFQGEMQFTDRSNDTYSLFSVSAEQPVTARVTLREFSTLTKVQVREKIKREAEAKAKARWMKSPKGAIVLDKVEKSERTLWIEK